MPESLGLELAERVDFAHQRGLVRAQLDGEELAQGGCLKIFNDLLFF
jgi:hypothetical protein